MGDLTIRRGPVRLGVDIGQAQDFTAIVATQEERRGTEDHYVVRSIQRMPLGTSYPVIADRIAEAFGRLRERSVADTQDGGRGFRVELLVDATGVGAPVIDLIRDAGLKPTAVTLTGGNGLTEREGDQISMAKAYLVSRLQVQLQTGRLHLPETAEATLLARELQDYQIDFTQAGNATFNARSGQHDDLVIALGLSTGTGLPPPRGGVVAYGKAKRRTFSF